MVAAASGPGRPRRSSSRARLRRNEARAAALSSRPRWAASGPRAVGRRTTPTQLKIGHGAASGAAPPPYFRPRRPSKTIARRSLPRPSGDLSAVPATAAGAAKAHMYRGKRSKRNAAASPLGARQTSPPAPRGAARPGQIRALRYAVVARPAHTAKTGSPSGAPGSNSPGGAGGGRAPHANETPAGAPA